MLMINYELIYNSLPQLAQGAWITLKIAALAFTFGFAAGMVIAFLQTLRKPWISWIITAYVTLIRGTPLLLQITFMYYLLPMVGITLSNFWVAVCAFSINSSAYVSQIIRSGIAAVGKAPVEAAYVLGFKPLQIARYIVFPQALRIVLPALLGEIITLIKDSSLASAIGVMELYKESRMIMNQTYDVITIFFIVGAFYLIVTSCISLLAYYLQRKMNTHAHPHEYY